MDNPHSAVGPNHPVFRVISRPPAYSSGRCLCDPRAVLWMNQVQPALMPFWNVSGQHSENPAKLVRKHHVIGTVVPLPPTKMRDPLCLFQPRFILVQLIQCPLEHLPLFRQRSWSFRLPLALLVPAGTFSIKKRSYTTHSDCRFFALTAVCVMRAP